MATETRRRRWVKRRLALREASNEMHRRHFAIRAEDVRDDGSFKLIAATDRACDVGPYDERLMCGAENVDHSAAHSLLLNHKSASLVGGIKSIQTNGSDVTAEVTVDPDAKMETGIRVVDAVKRGYLRGVSIGYTYKWSDAKREGAERVTITVNKWSLREVTLTPIPADTAASVRALPETDCAGAGERAQKTQGETEMKWRDFLIALLRAAGQDITLADAAEKAGVDSIEKAQVWFDQRQDDAKKPEPKPEPKNELEKEREARVEAERKLALSERESKIRRLAQAFDVDVAGLDYAKSERELTDELVRRHAEAKKTNIDGNASVEVTRDMADKAGDAAADGILDMAGFRAEKDLGMRGLSILDIGRRWLSSVGIRSGEMSKLELAKALLGKDQAGRHVRAGAVSAGNFSSYVLVNAMDKVVLQAFKQFGDKTTYQIWTTRREVMDFKTFYGGGLSTGNLKKTTENVAFEELSKGEGGYSDALDMWGGTLSLSLQALVNDDLGEFMDILARSGAIAARTVDKEVYAQLAAATWTNRTFTSGSLAIATLDKAYTALMDTTGPEADGEKLLVTPKYLIVPTGLRTTAKQMISVSSDAVAPTSRYYHDGLEVIVTPMLTTASTASQSTWYLAGDQLFSPVVVAFLRGMSTPQIEEYDQGAVASRGWKIYLPFVPVVTPTYGIYRATHT